jgi:hypothetical protein
MHALRKTNQNLVFVDSTIWIAVLLLGFSAFGAYRSYVQGLRMGFVAVGFALLCAFLFWRKEIVTFDAGRQQAEWTRWRAFKVASGTVPFSEITGIGTETTSDSHGVLMYRLTILTADKPVAMSDVYSANQSHYEAMRQQILAFLHLDADDSTGTDDESSIVSLLKQGRRIDAIQMLRHQQKLGLAEATDRVAEILEKMKVTQ